MIYADTMRPLVPSIHQECLHITTPTLDLSRHRQALLPNVDAKNMRKQLLRFSPLVASELPSLTCGEHCHNSLPVLCLELIGRIHKDEPEWLFTDLPQWSGEVEKVGCTHGSELGMIKRNEQACVQEGLDVRHA